MHRKNIPPGKRPGSRLCFFCIGAVLGAGLLLLSSGCSSDTAEKPSLTYWMELPEMLDSVTNFGETPFAAEYAKRTGIDITWIHPSPGKYNETLDMLIASGEPLPDIIESNWYSRSPEASIERGTIMRLNDILVNHAPNLTKFLSENKDIDKSVKTDNGSYYVFPFIRNGEKLITTQGFIIRDDWLKELNLESPGTIDQWEAVLTTFKEKKGAKAPFIGKTAVLKRFLGGFNTGEGFYVDEGIVKYGPIETGYKEFVVTMNRWYRNGLIDKNFAIMGSDYMYASMLNGISGATFGAGGSAMGVWLNSARTNGDENYSLAAVKFPAPEGQRPSFSAKTWPYEPIDGAAISGDCKDPALAARLLDYSYSEEGSMLNNFGIEGVSYNMVDGQPVYTGLVTDNPDGISAAKILPLYVRSANEAPIIQDERYIEQYYQHPAQKKSLEIWSENEYEKHSMPHITLATEELDDYNRIMIDISAYCEENTEDFIIGSRPIEEFEMFVEECKAKHIDRAIAIKQAAYGRYINRQ